MKTRIALLLALFSLPVAASAQDSGWLSLPAAAFSGAGAFPNATGTAQFFRTTAFAPVILPDNATVTFMACGGRAAFRKQIIFTLRRNEPQQENVDMVVLETALDATGFEFVSENQITDGAVDNRKFNYFIVADVSKPGGNSPGNRAVCANTSGPGGSGTQCLVGFCRLGYSLR